MNRKYCQIKGPNTPSGCCFESVRSPRHYQPFPFQVGEPFEVIGYDVVILASWTRDYDDTFVVSQLRDLLHGSGGANLRTGQSACHIHDFKRKSKQKLPQHSVRALPCTCKRGDSVLTESVPMPHCWHSVKLRVLGNYRNEVCTCKRVTEDENLCCPVKRAALSRLSRLWLDSEPQHRVCAKLNGYGETKESGWPLAQCSKNNWVSDTSVKTTFSRLYSNGKSPFSVADEIANDLSTWMLSHSDDITHLHFQNKMNKMISFSYKGQHISKWKP